MRLRRLKIGGMQRLDVRPGDRLILKAPYASVEQIQEAKRAWAEFAPDVPIIVLAGDIDASILPSALTIGEPVIRGDKGIKG